MHIGIEVKKNEVIIAFVSGNKSSFKALKDQKILLKEDSIQNYIDLRKNLNMFFQEEKIQKVSMISGGKDSSKIRIKIEFCIEEAAYQNTITFNTFSSQHVKKLQTSTFKNEMNSEFKAYFSSFPVHAYSHNACAVAWRFA